MRAKALLSKESLITENHLYNARYIVTKIARLFYTSAMPIARTLTVLFKTQTGER